MELEELAESEIAEADLPDQTDGLDPAPVWVDAYEI